MEVKGIVSDTSPLINLSGVGLIDFLPRLYGAVLISKVVVAEFQAKARPTDPHLEGVLWITVVDPVPVDPTLPPLGYGEASAISLALGLQHQAVLLDERKARRIAVQRHLLPIGTLAVLLRAKQHGLIPVVRPVIDTMRSQGRRFSSQLLDDVLRLAGE